MISTPEQIVLCNGATPPSTVDTDARAALSLDYRNLPGKVRNVNLRLPVPCNDLNHISYRLLDLLEIAAYIYCADRLTPRGPKDAVEYHSWSRKFHFVIRVRDIDFWCEPSINELLHDALSFMSGDRAYKFTFQPGHSTPPTSLFDTDGTNLKRAQTTEIALFSGGLDSLTGVVSSLETSNAHIYLISHCAQPGTVHTQDSLVSALTERYPDRISHYKFNCTLSGVRAAEETQRTRAFLYTSIAFAVAHAFDKDAFRVYENGVTAMNFPRRQDLMNARASRTTHPKTLGLMAEFFTKVGQSSVKIENPLMWSTKADLFRTLANCGQQNLITTTVSCSKTFQNLEHTSHCGGCFQCIDRRFGAHAAALDEVDHTGLYANDFIREPVEDGEARTSLVDYIRQASGFARSNKDQFYYDWLNELTDLVDYIDPADEMAAVTRVYDLCHRHGSEVETALDRMRTQHDRPFARIAVNSLLHIVNTREYLKDPIYRLVEEISSRLQRFIPIAFKSNHPKNENDLNDKISGLLQSWRGDFNREHPTVSFALAKAVADHSASNEDLLIETKYIRNSTSPSKASEGIAADIVKYPESCHILFLVYDPERAISNDSTFKNAIESKRKCTVCLIR